MASEIFDQLSDFVQNTIPAKIQIYIPEKLLLLADLNQIRQYLSANFPRSLPNYIPSQIQNLIPAKIQNLIPTNPMANGADDSHSIQNGHVHENGHHHSTTSSKKTTKKSAAGNLKSEKTKKQKPAKSIVLDGAIEKKLFPVEFQWNESMDANRVEITGDFYHWSIKIPLQKKSDKFYARIDLPKGRHEFKFIVDGEWKTSLAYPTTNNGFDDYNNYVQA